MANKKLPQSHSIRKSETRRRIVVNRELPGLKKSLEKLSQAQKDILNNFDRSNPSATTISNPHGTNEEDTLVTPEVTHIRNPVTLTAEQAEKLYHAGMAVAELGDVARQTGGHQLPLPDCLLRILGTQFLDLFEEVGTFHFE